MRRVTEVRKACFAVIISDMLTALDKDDWYEGYFIPKGQSLSSL